MLKGWLTGLLGISIGTTLYIQYSYIEGQVDAVRDQFLQYSGQFLSPEVGLLFSFLSISIFAGIMFKFIK